MYKNFYSEFLEGHKDCIHLASHSHHFWPDAAKEGMLQSWEMARTLSDDKWGYFFETLLPRVQNIISKQINFSRPKDMAFASNTHELLSRLISSLDITKPLTILTSDSEFHSFSRQIERLDELTNITLIKIPTENTEKFQIDFLKALEKNKIDLIFLSQVFFNSAKVVDPSFIQKIITTKEHQTIFALDGYHAYCATEVDISSWENDIFYIAGGYKYAQAGEGICFMTIPNGCTLRPIYTGWFASFDTLEKSNLEVQYDNSGMRFWGATIDQTAFFRFCAIWNNFYRHGLSEKDFIKYSKELQQEFLKDNAYLELIENQDLSRVGNFLCLKLESSEKAHALYTRLKEFKVLTDYRANILRFSFAPYISRDEVIKTKQILSQLSKEIP